MIGKNHIIVTVLCVAYCVCQENVYNISEFVNTGINRRPIIPGYAGEHFVSHQNKPHDHHNSPHSVQTVGPAQDLSVAPIPLAETDHELSFNVSWSPPLGEIPIDYSLEVSSIKSTTDCDTTMCYEYNIPSDARSWVIPTHPHPYGDSCSVRPGCSYRVRLIGHPWDGHTSASMDVELDECVSGVCSCAHAPRLPTPHVKTKLMSIKGELLVNVTWNLPQPKEPRRLPLGLLKRYYYVSIGKQMVSDAHPAPWYAHTINRSVETSGAVADGDSLRSILIPLLDQSENRKVTKSLILDVKLLARVMLVDERGCLGPAGNDTAYDPAQASKLQFHSYVLWAVFGGVCVLGVLVIIVIGTKSVKKILNALRPAPVSAPLQSLQLRPAWLPLQLRRNLEAPSRQAQMEQSPLYVQKEQEGADCDEYEVGWSQIRLGVLIGSGAFGRVHAAQLVLPSGDMTVAAKMLTDHASEEEMTDFLREIAMLKHVGAHKHVIRLVACCTKNTPFVALLEHAPRGDLLSLLRAARGKIKIDQNSSEMRRNSNVRQKRPSEADTEYTNLSDSDPTLTEGKLSDDNEDRRCHHYVAEPALHLDSTTMREYALHVALGMRHLEERGITHRDLAARNILVDGSGILKVSDFGLSRSGVYVHTRSRPVPLRWLAPEAILLAQYCNKSDVWAFAVLLWEIATLGGFPYAELSNHQVPAYLSGGSRLPKPARASSRLYQLMLDCWTENPEFRPNFKQVVDKLIAQQQLYVDLDCVFPPLEDEVNSAFSDYDFNNGSHSFDVR